MKHEHLSVKQFTWKKCSSQDRMWDKRELRTIYGRKTLFYIMCISMVLLKKVSFYFFLPCVDMNNQNDETISVSGCK